VRTLARVAHESRDEIRRELLWPSPFAASLLRISAFGHCGAMPQPTDKPSIPHIAAEYTYGSAKCHICDE